MIIIIGAGIDIHTYATKSKKTSTTENKNDH